jgi:hypothetical protein
MDWNNGEFILTDAAEQVDVQRTHELLSQTYWGVRRPYGECYETLMAALPLYQNTSEADSSVGIGRRYRHIPRRHS